MLFNTEAIVIRSLAYGETHAIVTLLTPSGTVGAMARGAKKPQSRLAAGVQLCVEGVYTLAQRSGMATIQQLEIVNSRRSLHEDLTLAAYAAYFCELVSTVAEERPGGSEVVYRWFRSALDRLAARLEAPSLVARVWEAKVLRLLGAAPDWTHCVRCGADLTQEPVYSPVDGGLLCGSCQSSARSDLPGGRGTCHLPVPAAVPRVLASFAAVPWERLGRVAVSPGTAAAVERILRIQLEEYAGVSLKSRQVLDHLEL